MWHLKRHNNVFKSITIEYFLSRLLQKLKKIIKNFSFSFFPTVIKKTQPGLVAENVTTIQSYISFMK